MIRHTPFGRTANGTLGEGKAGDRVQDRGLPPFRVCGASPSRLLWDSSVRPASIPGRRMMVSWWSACEERHSRHL
jgi:hypothetical protein